MLEELWDSGLWARVGMALLCGGIVGLERQLRGKPAGMRTSSLICLGTAMFIYLGHGLTGTAGDPSRVLGQVVTGIGFLGAGVIMTRNGLLTGVTSAAVIWLLAAVGSAIGIGRFGAALALAVVTVAVLVGIERLEHAFGALRRGVHGSSEGADAEDRGPTEPPPPGPRVPPGGSGAPPWR
jgi:putative Mg2+ transporter-C (MgtC) family protein